MVTYVVPDNPHDRYAMNKNRNWVPVYEDNLPLVYETLKKVILKGEASPEEIVEFDSLAEALELDTAADLDLRIRNNVPDGKSVWE
jgi:hypothetical protein